MIDMDRIVIEPELLMSLYHGNNFTQQDIADKFKCSRCSIQYKMMKYNIPVRTKSESQHLRTSFASRLGFKPSRLCIEKAIEANRKRKYPTKESHPNWISDREKLKTSIMKTLQMSNDWSLWREKVFIRDNYTCQICKGKSGKGKTLILHPHHIKPKAKYIESIFDVNNGITLCKNCHKWIHSVDSFDML